MTHTLVNWDKGLSFENYKKVLKSVGFTLIKAEKRDKDIIKTYSLLSNKMKKYISKRDVNYKNLYERYQEIVNSVKQGKMGWGIFVGKKK